VADCGYAVVVTGGDYGDHGGCRDCGVSACTVRIVYEGGW
jgi:hypothetical protein